MNDAESLLLVELLITEAWKLLDEDGELEDHDCGGD